jgi:hypothetical protein
MRERRLREHVAMTTPVRRLWQLIEPYHAITYFNPECDAAYEQIGLRGFWRGYFAGRAAPLGPVGPGLVTACFFGFEPGFVARAIPSIWSIVTPETAIQARMTGADHALHRLLGSEVSGPAVAEAADLARRAIDGAPTGGRPMFAANAELDWPADDAHLMLWHAATLVREHRGDGHVAALTAAGLHPCEAHLSQVAASGAGIETIQPYRGWGDDDWAMSVDRLRARGWLDGNGELTAEGRTGREAIEDTTDRLATEPLDRLGAERTARLIELLGPIENALARNDAIRYPNPIGVPRPD